jgi:hypothetical protein
VKTYPPFETTYTSEREPPHSPERESSAPPTQTSTIPRLLLAPSRGDNLSGMLGSLVKLYHLDVNGNSRLTRRAGMEMKFVAVMLSIIFLFDLAAWSFLWNMILNKGAWGFGWLTPVAVFCGFIFSAIIFVYERQFMTADTHGRWFSPGVVGPVSLRVLVIGIAAIVTTQPIEVAVFDGPIQRRVHEESVRNQAVSRLRDLEEAKTRSLGATGLEGTIEMSSYQDAQNKSEDARKQANLLRASRDVTEANIRRAQDSVAAAQRRRAQSPTEEGRRYWSGVAQAAATRAEQFRQELNGINGQIRASEANEKHWNDQTNNAKGDVIKRQETAQSDVTRLRNWIAQIRNSRPGKLVAENTTQPDGWNFQDEEYDFFQRLGVINDLYAGRPPRWHGATEQDRAALAAEYGLKDAADNDREEQIRQGADAHTFAVSWWAVVGIAAIIPMLLLAFKMLLPLDLSLYYSTKAQQAAGNYEALKFSHDGKGRLFADQRRGGANSNGHEVESEIEIDE